jgi:hypothetical protein
MERNWWRCNRGDLRSSRVVHALRDPTGSGGALQGMEANFPGNDGAVIFEMLPSTIGLSMLGAAIGAIGARLLRRPRASE